MIAVAQTFHASSISPSPSSVNHIETQAADIAIRGHSLHSMMDNTTAARPANSVENKRGIPTTMTRNTPVL